MNSINENSSNASYHSTNISHNITLSFDTRPSNIGVTPVSQYFRYDTQHNDVEVSDKV